MNNKENSFPSEPFGLSLSSKKGNPPPLTAKSPLQTLEFKNTQYISPNTQTESPEPTSPLDDYLLSRKRKWAHVSNDEWTFSLIPIDLS